MSTSTAPSSIEIVADKLASLRQQYSLARIAIEVALLIVVVLISWLCLATMDFFFELSIGQRRFGLTVALLAIAWLNFVRFRRAFVDSTPQRIVGMLEAQYNEFGQRLRTILDTTSGRVQAPAEMVRALGNQALGRWETAEPAKVIPLKKVWIGALACFVICASFVPVLLSEHWRISLQRAAGIEVPYSKLLPTPGNSKVLEGEDVRLSLDIVGRRNRQVSLQYRELPLASSDEDSSDSDESRWTEIELTIAETSSAKMSAGLANDSDESTVGDIENSQRVDNGALAAQLPFSMDEKATFGFSLRDLAVPVEYQFVTSAGRTEVFRIDVQPLVDVVEFEMEVTPPEYTGVGRRNFSQTKINVLQDSIVKATITTSQPLEEAYLSVGPRPKQLQPVDALRATDDPTVWKFELPTTSSLYWQFTGTSSEKVPLSPYKGRLRVRTDGPPKLTWREPGREIKVTPLTEVTLAVDVSDDYGLQESGIIFQLGDEEEFTLAEFSSGDDSSEASRRGVRLSEVLPLESFGLGQFDFVSYYAYAIDNRVGSPQRVESDLRYIDIRPLRQYYADGSSRTGNGEGGGGFATSVSEIIRRQRSLINQTRRLVRAGAVSLQTESQMASVDLAVDTQSELAGFVRFLINRLVERGFDDSVDALNAAETTMLLAADSLSVGQLALAQKQQQEAMRALVEANDELEQLTASLTGEQRQSLRESRRQLEQMLQLASGESDERIARELRAIASAQRKLGIDAQQLHRETQELGPSADNTDAPQVSSADVPQLSSIVPDVSSNSIDGGTDSQDAGADLGEQLYSRLEKLEESQILLQERLVDASDELSEEMAESELVVERFREIMDAMDSQVSAVRSEALPEFSSECPPIADSLEELALLVESLAPTDTVDRIGAIRDLAASMSQMEGAIADKLRQLAAANDANEDEPETADESAQLEEELEQLRDSLEERISTLREALQQLDALQDDGDGTERLSKLLEETEFLQTLEDSQAVAEEGVLSSLTEQERLEAAEEAQQRAEEFRNAAIEMENLYRELVAPKLEKLRELERSAEEVQRAVQQNGELSSADVASLQQLAVELRAIGMNDAADLILNDQGMSPEALQAVLNVLRARIQELVLLEVGAEGDTAVPARYEELVDLYFRALSGDVEADE